MSAVGVIIGSTRPGRVGAQVAEWVVARAALVAPVDVDLIDLAKVGLPFLDEVEEPSVQTYAHRHTQEWSSRVGALDAVVLVTPEYNSSFPAPLKNALDVLYREWRAKPVALVGYGNTSAGTRAVAALMPVVVALGMVPAGAVQIPLRQRLDSSGALRLTSSDDAALDGLLVQLLELTRLLQPVPTGAA